MKTHLMLLACLLLAACGGEAASPTAVPAPIPTTTTPVTPAEPTETMAETAVFPPANGLLFMQIAPGSQTLARFDLNSSEVETLFIPLTNSWLSLADSNPDGSEFVLAYAPPPPDGEVQMGFTQLYLLTNGDTTPRLLIEPQQAGEIFFYPDWTADGRFIYYSHVVQQDNAPFTTTLERFDRESGESKVVADNGIWGRVSPNGRLLAYVLVNLEALTRELVVSEADGSNPRTLVTQEDFADMDAPFFSPDSQWLYFSAVPLPQSSWWDRLLGVEAAAAHAVPSDWWRIPVGGGSPEQISHINEAGLYGGFAPDGTQIAFASQTGLYTMNPDGSNLQKRLETSAGVMLTWIP